MTPEETKSLITLAAKALGYKLSWHHDQFAVVCSDALGESTFNPLTSLADRAKMCDELEIDIVWLHDIGEVVAGHWDSGLEVHESFIKDKSAACSIACLRVAAAIGNQLKGE